jgi:protein required for attachment to host cells
MARGDFPLDRHRLNLRAVVACPRVRVEVGVPLNDRKLGVRHADQRDTRRFLDGRRLVEDDFAAATAAFLNKLSLDRTIEHLVLVSDPRTLGGMRKHLHRDLREARS